MNGEAGFFYLRVGDDWPNSVLSSLEVGSDGALVLEAVGDALSDRGAFLAGPFAVTDRSTRWHRLQVVADQMPAGTHIRLFTLTTDGDAVPVALASETPFAAPNWQALPTDALDALVLNPPARNLWIGGLVLGNGQSSPVLRQLRVEYGRDTYLSQLPAIYGRQAEQRDFLERFLSLPESVLDALEDAIIDLPRLFDPYTVPDGDFPSWLSWLASWLAFDLSEAWREDETRNHLAQAFELYGQRGTVAGLRRYLKLYAGVEARIEEPGLQTTLWSLGETSTLGFTTMLAPAHAQGAVLGTTATLDQSYISQDDDFGAALFDDLAHHFCVQVYCVELSRPGALEDVQALLERERPAHTNYHLCVIEPRMRVGVQARVGIDAIVAQGPPSAHTGMVLGTAVLSEEAEPSEPQEENQCDDNE